MEKLNEFAQAHSLYVLSDAIGAYHVCEDNSGQYRIIRADSKRAGGYVVLAESFDNIESAFAAIPHDIPKAVNNFLRASGWAAGSELHGSLLVVSRPVAGRSREWRIARLSPELSGQVAATSYKSRGEALAHLMRESGFPKPTQLLGDVPSFPYGRYMGRS